MFLIDTDVLSALRRPDRSPRIVRWMAGQGTTDLYLSVVSVGEIERGVVRKKRSDPAFARVLAAWLDSVIALYGARILAVDLSTARRWGRLSGAIGHESPDLLIAATAIEHGLTVVTCNIRHFEPTGVPVLDPLLPRP
jgi:predicted nucleic acid-binding protein